MKRGKCSSGKSGVWKWGRGCDSRPAQRQQGAKGGREEQFYQESRTFGMIRTNVNRDR